MLESVSRDKKREAAQGGGVIGFGAALVSAVVVIGLVGAGPAFADDAAPNGSAAPAQSADTTTSASTPSPAIVDNGAMPTARAIRGDVAARTASSRLTVSTPPRGQTTIARVIVDSRTTPAVKVAAPKPSPGTKKITVVGGVKRLSGTRAGVSRYAVTVPIIKPRIKGTSSKGGKLAISIAGAGLKVISHRLYTKTFTRRVSGEMCNAVSAFDLANRDPRVRVAFGNKILFGRQMTGFGHAQYVGTYALLQACQGKAPQSYVNMVAGKKAAALNTRALQPRASSSPVNTGPGTTDAVVLVSGFLSQTPFTTPGAACTAPNMSTGGTWYAMSNALSSQGFPVYTSPESAYTYGVPNAPVPVQINPSSMGMGTCAQPQLPASMTMNTAGDFDINSSILANYLNYLNVNFGVTRVWLVGHSDGGMWARGAMDYAAFMPGIQIQSITTIDTPYTGSFLANTGQDQLQNPCGTFDLICQGKEAALNALIDNYVAELGEGAALDEMTATSTAAWNSRMAGVPGATPFYAASSVGINDPDFFSTFSSGTGNDAFYNPNDIAVGLSSQQADGLVANGTISAVNCFATIPGLHTEVPATVLTIGQDTDLINTFPGSTTPVTTNPMTITNVTAVLSGTPPTGGCPSANYQQSGQYAPGQFGPWPDN
ncbi:MAG: alpha/beta hydrolase [Actinomycetes bacterium]